MEINSKAEPEPKSGWEGLSLWRMPHLDMEAFYSALAEISANCAIISFLHHSHNFLKSVELFCFIPIRLYVKLCVDTHLQNHLAWFRWGINLLFWSHLPLLQYNNDDYDHLSMRTVRIQPSPNSYNTKLVYGVLVTHTLQCLPSMKLDIHDDNSVCFRLLKKCNPYNTRKVFISPKTWDSQKLHTLIV